MDGNARKDLRARDRELPDVCTHIKYRFRNYRLPFEGGNNAMRSERKFRPCTDCKPCGGGTEEIPYVTHHNSVLLSSAPVALPPRVGDGYSYQTSYRTAEGSGSNIRLNLPRTIPRTSVLRWPRLCTWQSIANDKFHLSQEE